MLFAFLNPRRLGLCVALMAFALSSTLQAAPQVAALEGSCVLPDGSPAAGAVEVFFDLVGAAAGESVATATADLAPDGTYRVDVPPGAKLACLRATVGPSLHFAARVSLMGRRAVDAHELEPLVCGESVPAKIDITHRDGGSPGEGALYFFPKTDYVGDSFRLSEAARRCYHVAEVKGLSFIKGLTLPKVGGYIRFEGAGTAPAFAELTYDTGLRALRAKVELKQTVDLVGRAPSMADFDAEGTTGRVLIATVTGPHEGQARGEVAFGYFMGTSSGSPFSVRAGQSFRTFGSSAFFPVLGAWPENSDPAKEVPYLIACIDPLTKRYQDWFPVQAARYAIDFSNMPKRERARLAQGKFWGNLHIKNPGVLIGSALEVEVRGETLEVTCREVCPTKGHGRLELHRSGVLLFAQKVPFEAGTVELTPHHVPKTTELTIRVVDADSGDAVPGVRVTAVLLDAELDYDRVQLDGDADGRCSGLFERGASVQIIPDKARFGPVGKGANVVKLDGFEQTVEIPVSISLGEVRVTTELIDDQPFRMALIPEEDDETDSFHSYRTSFPIRDEATDAWALEAVGPEIAAVAIRPGRSYVFDSVPEGRYILAVQTDLDLTAGAIYADMLAGTSGPYARRIEVKRGEATEVTLEAPQPIRVVWKLKLDKPMVAEHRRMLRKSTAPTAVAVEHFVVRTHITQAEGKLSTPLSWTKDGELLGTLQSNRPYIIHISGLGDVDSAHLIRTAPEAQPDLRLDGAVEFEVRGGKNRTYAVEVRSIPMSSQGEHLGYEVPTATLTRAAKRGVLRISGLSPFAEHRVTISRQGESAEVELGALASDPEAALDKRSRALTKTVKVELR